ncbi:YbhB/YbcL family Raf kinase inhibitor-like protein [Aspergillus fijiensis CBS 313.89]|uniref:Putative protease inhibitor n=1 Tax=Aspergillus fijiensis CBS 313.89 TaxID=1448319 RepID=A0A8G1S3B8_9EURO|nr:putative protease inhibitor [Aspergillus fijiensis CBS 313.89]RAK81726.1 putative protease inhibitor [Aspergillus fijiensis CBS 313.89]
MPANRSVKKALSLIEADATKVLGLNVGQHRDVQPGQYIPRAEAQSPPELSFGNLSPSTTYMVIGLDIDAPFPSFGVLGPILHWIQPGLQPTASETDSSVHVLKVTAPFVANYIGPAPPPGSSPHRYIFFLYEQPADFVGERYAPPGGQKLGNMHRMRYDLDAAEVEFKLGKLVAVNYFTSN